MLRVLAGTAVAALGAVVAVIGQMSLARWLRVLVPDQDYTAGNDTWPFQLVLLAWFTAAAAVLGCAAARRVVPEAGWRWAAAAPAGLGALAALSSAQGWAAGATAVGDAAVTAAARAVLTGAALGAAAGAAALVWRSAARGAVVWVGWVWLTVLAAAAGYGYRRPSRGYVVPADPLGLWTPEWLAHRPFAAVGALLPPLVLGAFLGWWARRQRDRFPLLAAVAGPLLLVAVHAAVRELPTGRDYGDHYNLDVDLAAWLLVTVLGTGAGALGTVVDRRRAVRRRPGAPEAPRVMLLIVLASLLGAAALLGLWSSRPGWLEAAAACLALGAALAVHHHATLSRLAGACSAAAGVAGLAVLAALLGGRALSVDVLPGFAGSLVVAALVGALARGARGAAWFALAVGVLPVARPFTTVLSGEPRVSFGDSYTVLGGVLGLLAIGAAATVLRMSR